MTVERWRRLRDRLVGGWGDVAARVESPAEPGVLLFTTPAAPGQLLQRCSCCGEIERSSWVELADSVRADRRKDGFAVELVQWESTPMADADLDSAGGAAGGRDGA